MKSARKYVLLGLAVVLFAALLSGCSVAVTPRYGDIKICTDDPSIYGHVYIDDEYTGYCIDGAEWWPGCYRCTGWITVTLHEKHYLEVWDPESHTTTYYESFTPTRDGEKWISN